MVLLGAFAQWFSWRQRLTWRQAATFPGSDLGASAFVVSSHVPKYLHRIGGFGPQNGGQKARHQTRHCVSKARRTLCAYVLEKDQNRNQTADSDTDKDSDRPPADLQAWPSCSRLKVFRLQLATKAAKRFHTVHSRMIIQLRRPGNCFILYFEPLSRCLM